MDPICTTAHRLCTSAKLVTGCHFSSKEQSLRPICYKCIKPKNRFLATPTPPPCVKMPFHIMRLTVIAFFFSTSYCLAQSPSKQINFKDDIYPLLDRRCFECHQGKDAEAGYRLDLREEILGQTNGQPLAIVGDAGKSEIIKRITATDKTRMPPKGNKRLPESEIATLRTWIDQGLSWDDKLLPPLVMTSDHWAFQPIKAPAIPSAKAWCKSSIDNFIGAAHAAKDLKPAPQADRRTLIRRVTFDLTGLPPTYEEMERFAEAVIKPRTVPTTA